MGNDTYQIYLQHFNVINSKPTVWWRRPSEKEIENAQEYQSYFTKGVITVTPCRIYPAEAEQKVEEIKKILWE